MQWRFLSFALVALTLFPAKAKAEWVCRTQSGGVSVGDGDMHMEPDAQVCDWVDSGGATPGSGPAPGGSTGQYCTAILLAKPTGCASVSPIEGADYGADKFVIGSGLAAAIANISNGNLSSQARAQIFTALTQHTANLSDIRKSFNDVNTILIDSMVVACEYQRQYDELHPPFSPHAGGVSPGLRSCLGTVARLNAEANLSFTAFFQGWLNSVGIVLADLGVPQTVVNWFSPENSLTVKFEVADAQNQCNLWFGEVRKYGC